MHLRGAWRLLSIARLTAASRQYRSVGQPGHGLYDAQCPQKHREAFPSPRRIQGIPFCPIAWSDIQPEPLLSGQPASEAFLFQPLLQTKRRMSWRHSRHFNKCRRRLACADEMLGVRPSDNCGETKDSCDDFFAFGGVHSIRRATQEADSEHRIRGVN